MNILFQICLFLLIFVFDIKCAKVITNSKCSDKSRLTIDAQIGTVFPGLNGVKAPETEKQLQKFCVSVSEALDSVSGYLKSCAGTFGPMMAKVIVGGINKEMKPICKSENNERTSAWLKLGRCVNRASTGMDKCMSGMLDGMTQIQLAPEKDRIKLGCCNKDRSTRCFQRLASKTKGCKDILKRPEIYGFSKNDIEMADQFCGSISYNCTEKAPKLNKKNYVRPKSIFLPLINILDSYRVVECTLKREQSIDKAVAEMLSIGQRDPIPENTKQLRNWCSKLYDLVPNIYGYVESCASDMTRMLAKVMANVVPEHMEPYCAPNYDILDKPSEEIREYIKAAKCGNKAEDKIEVCFEKFTDGIMGIIEAPDMSRIRMACCNAFQFRSCIFNGTSSTKGCTVQTIEWAENAVLHSAQPLIDLMCQEHWADSEKCRNLLSQIPKLDPKTYVRPKSLFIPFMKLLDSFPEVE